MAVTVELDDEFYDRLALALARRNLADGGLVTQELPQQPAPQSQPEADPWDDAWPSSQSGSVATTAPPRGNPAPQQTRPTAPPGPTVGTFVVNTPKGQQTWTLGAGNAPACLCGEPAGYVTGYTNGKQWKRWACAKGSGDDWRSKCSFSQWA